jgi:transcriptional regulator with XRE-family HTH domain
MESRSVDFLCRLAKGLQVDLDELFSLEGERHRRSYGARWSD